MDGTIEAKNVATEDRQHADTAQQRADRERSLDAMHVLEATAGRPAPGREEEWRAALAEAVRGLEQTFEEQRASYTDPTGLMAQIARDEPHLRTWVRQLEHRWDELADTGRRLRESTEASGSWSVADLREQLRWLMSALHHHRAREADIVFEALGCDLGQTADDRSHAVDQAGQESS
jgi:hypothetical protein